MAVVRAGLLMGHLVDELEREEEQGPEGGGEGQEEGAPAPAAAQRAPGWARLLVDQGQLVEDFRTIQVCSLVNFVLLLFFLSRHYQAAKAVCWAGAAWGGRPRSACTPACAASSLPPESRNRAKTFRAHSSPWDHALELAN